MLINSTAYILITSAHEHRRCYISFVGGGNWNTKTNRKKHRKSLTGPLPAGLCPNDSFNCAKQRLPSSAFSFLFTEMMLVLVPEPVLGWGICKHLSNISQTAFFPTGSRAKLWHNNPIFVWESFKLWYFNIQCHLVQCCYAITKCFWCNGQTLNV